MSSDDSAPISEVPWQHELLAGDLPLDKLADAYLDDEDLPQIIGRDLANARGHVNRLYEQEPDCYTTLRRYSSVFDMVFFQHIGKCLSEDIQNKYFAPYSSGAKLEFKDDATEADFEKFEVEKQKKTGLPRAYCFVKYANISKDEFEKAMIKYADSKGMDYVPWMTDGFYSDDARVLIETYMSPEMVLDIDMYYSDQPKLEYHEVTADYGVGYTTSYWDYTRFLKFPMDILGMSVEQLDGWGYSDEYWFDYYSFLSYLAAYDASGAYDESSIAMNSVRVNTPEYAELNRRLEIYAARVGKSPATGDDARRAVVLICTAAFTALIPAVLSIAGSRRKKYMH